MLVLVHGRPLPGTHHTHGQLLKLLGDGGSRLCSCMTILVTALLVHWRGHSEQGQDGLQAGDTLA